jgi:pyruvate formate lyase activating enzyme
MEAAEVVAEVLKDEPFYETSGGGMTLSGGEPLLQPDFIAEVLESAQAAGLHTAMETCGHADRTAFERIRSLVDLFFYDVKETDPERHRRFTGVDNALILDNLAWLHGTGSRVIVRLPLVPGLNDTEAHFRGFAALARKLPDLDGFEIMPYHRLGESKLDRLGIPREGRPDCEAPPPKMIDGWSERLLELGVPLLNEKQA